uniref:Uncharacterized protein n=1 Tax=Molossus molossus TaxID=27622 RepID=A0A7J8DC64_MOLMO|nr:hypothetical protein HJG59_009374 [Molossus molossus]
MASKRIPHLYPSLMYPESYSFFPPNEAESKLQPPVTNRVCAALPHQTGICVCLQSSGEELALQVPMYEPRELPSQPCPRVPGSSPVNGECRDPYYSRGACEDGHRARKAVAQCLECTRCSIDVRAMVDTMLFLPCLRFPWNETKILNL